MGSSDKDQTTQHHQPLLSSLVVRPSVSDGGDAAGGGRGGRTGGSEYEPGEVRRDPPPYSRSDRFSDDPGYRIHAGSGSPVRRRDADHRHSSDFDHSRPPTRSHEFSNGRDSNRLRDSSPPHARGRAGGRALGSRGFDGPGFGAGSFRGEGMSRNNPNIRPREGDWYCPDALCGNLNFGRREYCNNCKKPRPHHGPGGSPRRAFPGPLPPHVHPRRFPGPPLDLSPGRTMSGYRSPPRAWPRDGPRDFMPAVPPPPRHEGRFSDHDMRRDRSEYPEDDYRARNKFDRPMPMDWGHRDRGRDPYFVERKGFDRRAPSPPPFAPPPFPPQRGGRWGRDLRERSRSPVRGGPPLRDNRGDMYMERGRDDRRGMGRGRMGNAY